MPERAPTTQKKLFSVLTFVASLWAGFAPLADGETNQLATGAAPKSRVVLAQDSAAMTGFKADAGKVRALVSAGIRALTGTADDAAAWRCFVSSNDVVGIKIATQAAPLHATKREVVDAIAVGLSAAGVAATNIIVWDRDASKMRQAGFEPGDPRPDRPYRVSAVVPDTGWDDMAYYESKLIGKLIWGDLLFGRVDERLSTRSHYPKVLTQRITKLIDVPVLQDHEACGVWGCVYNVSLGMVDNTRRFESLGQRGDPMCAEIGGAPLVRDKLVLHVLDALIGGYAGGPAFKPQYSWAPGALYFSRDPASVDTLAVELLEAKRREAQVPAIGPAANHVVTAARYGLGVSDRKEIELLVVKPPSQ
jgi:hypothetical protein